jgi:hypothetical protein
MDKNNILVYGDSNAACLGEALDKMCLKVTVESWPGANSEELLRNSVGLPFLLAEDPLYTHAVVVAGQNDAGSLLNVETLANLRALADLAGKHGAKVAVILLPSFGEIEKVRTAVGIYRVHPLLTMNRSDLYEPDEDHWSSTGASVVAASLMLWLQEPNELLNTLS